MWKNKTIDAILFDQMESKNTQKIYSTDVSMLIDTYHMMILGFVHLFSGCLPQQA